MDFFWGGGLWEEEELCNLRSLKDTLKSKIIRISLFFFIVNGENIFDNKIFCKIAFWDNLQSSLTISKAMQNSKASKPTTHNVLPPPKKNPTK